MFVEEKRVVKGGQVLLAITATVNTLTLVLTLFPNPPCFSLFTDNSMRPSVRTWCNYQILVYQKLCKW